MECVYMKKLNQKGFTLIEIIGAVTILSIITVLALRAYVSYLDWSRKKAFDNMAKSASTAAEQYIMDNPSEYMETEAVETEEGTKYVFKDDEQFTTTFKKLIENGYISLEMINGVEQYSLVPTIDKLGDVLGQSESDAPKDINMQAEAEKIIAYVEKNFGRVLSNSELLIIKRWFEEGLKIEEIK